MKRQTWWERRDEKTGELALYQWEKGKSRDHTTRSWRKRETQEREKDGIEWTHWPKGKCGMKMEALSSHLFNYSPEPLSVRQCACCWSFPFQLWDISFSVILSSMPLLQLLLLFQILYLSQIMIVQIGLTELYYTMYRIETFLFRCASISCFQVEGEWVSEWLINTFSDLQSILSLQSIQSLQSLQSLQSTQSTQSTQSIQST